MKKYYLVGLLALVLVVSSVSAAREYPRRQKLIIRLQTDAVYDDPNISTNGDSLNQRITFNLYPSDSSRPLKFTRLVTTPIDYGRSQIAELSFALPPNQKFTCITAKNQFSVQSKALVTEQDDKLLADFTAGNKLIQGDLNHDGIIDKQDVAIVDKLLGSSKPRDLRQADINQDGMIFTPDFTFVQINFGKEDSECN